MYNTLLVRVWVRVKRFAFLLLRLVLLSSASEASLQFHVQRNNRTIVFLSSTQLIPT